MAAPESYELHGTYHDAPSELLPVDHQYRLDLTDNTQISDFVNALSGISFDAVLFFAASYSSDPENVDDFLATYQRDLQLSAVSTVAIAKSLSLKNHAKLILFGDAGLGHPKKAHTAYSISKFTVADVARLLAVELAPQVSTVCLRLGPTLKADNTSPSATYYDRALLKVADPTAGLVNFIYFLISEHNFNATGCTIDYDGGAYIKRPQN